MEESKKQKMNVLILTKSAKYGEFCVAGITCNKLVRLVADASGKEINKENFKANNNEVQVGDEIEIQCTLAPLKIQTENTILNKINKVVKHYDFKEIDKAMSNIINNGDLLKTQDFAISHEEISTYNKSLMIVEVSDFETEITKNKKGQPKTKAKFKCNGIEYANFSVTDQDYFNVPKLRLF